MDICDRLDVVARKISSHATLMTIPVHHTDGDVVTRDAIDEIKSLRIRVAELEAARDVRTETLEALLYRCLAALEMRGGSVDALSAWLAAMCPGQKPDGPVYTHTFGRDLGGFLAGMTGDLDELEREIAALPGPPRRRSLRHLVAVLREEG